MNNRLRVCLYPTPEDRERLVRLQEAFASACNEVAALAQQTRCWNRVALHHMAYRELRSRHPGLGSQMACNVIHAVSRACRAVYQGRGSPYSLQALGAAPLPRVQFDREAPVYFDRHTLSIRNRQASLFTLDGRIRFEIALAPGDETRLAAERLVEILLHRRQGEYVLDFFLAAAAPGQALPKEEVLPAFIRVDAPPPAAADEATLPGVHPDAASGGPAPGSTPTPRLQ